jgi:formamidopyrimidine-DNA glycosylase
VLKGGTIVEASFLRKDLRDPIPMAEFRELLVGEKVEDVFRRSKYMLVKSRRGYGVFHLGMTGAIMERSQPEPQEAHTHAVFKFVSARGKEKYLHFVDPRRFGRIACVKGATYEKHAFFADLGPEPLTTKELGKHLFETSRGRTASVKAFIMNARNVVGVGNIYASESLFRAGIHPKKKAGQISRERYERLAREIKATLEDAIKAGGTTFSTYRNYEGNPGLFVVQLNVYDRKDEPCVKCGEKVRQITQTGRSTFFCAFCQS